MQLTYDPRHSIAYIRILPLVAEVTTIRLGDSLNVDIAPDGTVYRFELLNANEQLLAGDEGALIVINEAAGLRSELRLVETE